MNFRAPRIMGERRYLHLQIFARLFVLVVSAAGTFLLSNGAARAHADVPAAVEAFERAVPSDDAEVHAVKGEVDARAVVAASFDLHRQSSCPAEGSDSTCCSMTVCHAVSSPVLEWTAEWPSAVRRVPPASSRSFLGSFVFDLLRPPRT